MKRVFICLLWLLYLNATLMALSNPVPLIDTPLVPTSVVPGGPGFTLSVNGAGFVSGAVVYWNGKPRGTQFISKTQVTASILASDIAQAGTGAVTVSNPGSGSLTSNTAFLSVVEPITTVTLSGEGFSIGGNGLQSVTGDFNGDGKLDIASANFSEVQVLLGEGNGTFAPAVSYNAGNSPWAIAAADVNGDGKLDLLVVNYGSNNVSVLLGKGDGTFGSPTNFATGSGPSAIAVADFNGDGKLDLAISSYENTVVLLGNGDGTFQTQTPLVGQALAICVGDFNRDGIPDIAIALYLDDVKVFLGNGDGSFQQGKTYSDTQVNLLSITAADLNGDGILDLILGANGYSVLMGNGDGTFASPINYEINNGGYAAVADLNGDGKLDLILASSYTILALLGNGDGTFGSPSTFEGAVGNANVTTGDFNGDGAMDVLTSARGPFSFGNGSVYAALQTAGPAVLFSSPYFSFPLQLEGTPSASQSTVMTNVGQETLAISKIGFSGSNTSDFKQVNNCGSSLAVGANCTIKVTFDPTDRGTRAASLVVTDDAVGRQQPVPLSGIGTWIGLSPGSLSFGDQKKETVSPPQTVTVTNVGSGAVTLSKIYFTGGSTNWFTQTNTCGSTLAPGANCTISVQFAPQEKGSVSDNLTLTDNGGGSQQQIVVSGTGD
ncbi:MAG: FG-GAP-like repeat-containing protein [Candidatus Sulfotelmatobacter sp.]